VIVKEAEVMRREPPPHGAIGMSTAYRISDAAPNRTMEFRKRVPAQGRGHRAASHRPRRGLLRAVRARAT
jgi:hypothetical protein